MLLGPILATFLVLGPADDVAARVAGSPPGSEFLLEAGTYHKLTLAPKDGMTFIGERGAVLDGDDTAPRAFVGLFKGENFGKLIVKLR